MSTKRPFAGEGHLRLPAAVAPAPDGAGRAPFDRGGRTRLLDVGDDRLAALDVRAGDRVVLAEGRAVEFGDLALVETSGQVALWKVFPEGADVALSDGVTRRTVPGDAARVLGVVLGVLRRLD